MLAQPPEARIAEAQPGAPIDPGTRIGHVHLKVADIDRARERKGMAVAAVRDWQLLVAGPYARLAAEAGLIGFACTNFVPLVAPPGGRTAVFGTNPFAYGIPTGHQPVVLDVATTVSSMQKVRVAAQQGTPVPEGVIFDPAGRPTTDPVAFLEGGSMTPLGYPHAPHKGFGLALFVDALGGVLSGAGFAQGVAGGAPGSLLWALDVEAFLPRQEFLARMDAQLDQVKQGERLAGVGFDHAPRDHGLLRAERQPRAACRSARCRLSCVRSRAWSSSPRWAATSMTGKRSCGDSSSSRPY